MTGKAAPQSGTPQDAQGTTAAREQLEGYVPSLATPDEIRAALDKAFDYRGDVTLTLHSGVRVEGYVFDRRSDAPTLDRCRVRMLRKDKADKICIPYSDIARLEFTGRDTAAGKGFELWVKKYRERKALGEKNISLEPEPLDE